MATSIHPSIPVLSPSFLYHPYIPSLQSKDFSFTCTIGKLHEPAQNVQSFLEEQAHTPSSGVGLFPFSHLFVPPLQMF